LIGFDALKKAKASPGRPQGVEASVVSGQDRLSDEDVDMAFTETSAFSAEETNPLEKAPASEAGSQTLSNGAGKSG
jgi:hypothetical protein